MSLLTTKRADMCYCPGCSHGMVLEQLGKALAKLNASAERTVLVSDIGCIGTADRYFACHTFHGLHGRSITYAEGIKRVRPDLLVIVVIGDGGCGIGTAHLVHAARRNADIKVIVFNNFNFGMTGGQHSPTTPPETSTSTTPGGATDYPFDLCATVAVNGAARAARHSAFDPELSHHFAAALQTSGFGLVDVWELCTAYFGPANKLDRSSLENLSQRIDLPFGVIHQRERTAHAAPVVRPDVLASRASSESPRPSPPRLPWTRRREICVAGSAGQRIRSAVGVIGEVAVACDLYAAQKDDFPITVRRGFSISNLIIAPRPILHTGLDAPDLVVLVSAEGLQRLGPLAQLPSSVVVVAPDAMALGDTVATIERFDLHALEKRVERPAIALASLAFGLVRSHLIDGDSLLLAAESVVNGPYREANLAAIKTGVDFAGQEAQLKSSTVLSES